MFDIGWTELLLIGIVALIVIGPKDLPDMFRTLGRFTTKARGMAREFQRAMETAADEAGVKDVAKDLKTMTSAKNLGLDSVKDAASKFEKWDPMKPAAKSTTPKGPATQALADANEAKRAAAAKPAADPAPAAAPAKPAPAAPKTKPAATPKAKPAAAPAKPAPTPKAKPAAAKAAAPKAKPAKKSDA